MISLADVRTPRRRRCTHVVAGNSAGRAGRYWQFLVWLRQFCLVLDAKFAELVVGAKAVSYTHLTLPTILLV